MQTNHEKIRQSVVEAFQHFLRKEITKQRESEIEKKHDSHYYMHNCDECLQERRPQDVRSSN